MQGAKSIAYWKNNAHSSKAKADIDNNNQAFELGKVLSHKLNIPISKDILIRSRDTAPQTSLPYDQRKRNMRRAFKLNDAMLPNHIALIDDVLTTGHTVNAAAKLFRQEGVTTIELWTIARTIRHD